MQVRGASFQSGFAVPPRQLSRRRGAGLGHSPTQSGPWQHPSDSCALKNSIARARLETQDGVRPEALAPKSSQGGLALAWLAPGLTDGSASGRTLTRARLGIDGPAAGCDSFAELHADVGGLHILVLLVRAAHLMSACSVSGFGFRVWDFGCRVWGFGWGFRVSGFGYRVECRV